MSDIPITRILAAELTVETHYGKNVLSLFLVVIFAALGGFLTMQFQERVIKKHLPAITIPHLVGMIAFGCIARNAFGEITVLYYPDAWADWIRQICLCIILMRGGLELEFEGTGLVIVLLTIVP
jgi:hypothetical protein